MFISIRNARITIFDKTVHFLYFGLYSRFQNRRHGPFNHGGSKLVSKLNSKKMLDLFLKRTAVKILKIQLILSVVIHSCISKSKERWI